MTRRQTYYLSAGPMAETRWIAALAALDRLQKCHDAFADCHKSNHTKWEGEALLLLRGQIESMLAKSRAKRPAGDAQ